MSEITDFVKKEEAVVLSFGQRWWWALMLGGLVSGFLTGKLV